VRVGPKEEFTIPRMISLMVGRDINQLYPERTSKPTDKVLLKVHNLSKAGMIHDIQFELHEGELMGLFGLMGSGRSELAQILFGLDGYDRGEVMINGKKVTRLSPSKSISNKVAFITENRREEGLLMNATVADNLGLASLRNYLAGLNIIKQSPLSKAIQDMVVTLKIKVTSVFKNQAKGLSGGNQQKVVLGKWLMTKPSILIADEPTRGVDIGAKHEIYSLLDSIAANGAAVMFISSEIEELIGMCDRIIVMGYGELLGSFDRGRFEKEEILRTAFREIVK
jgi:ABC-type sugar transport system ATPase subunit